MLADDQLLAEFNFNDSSSESDSDDTSCASITLDDSSEEGSACSVMNFTDEEYQEAFALGECIRSQTNPNKRQKVGSSREDTRPIAFIRLNIRQGKPKAVTLKALFDTGASESVITKEYAKKLRQRQNDKRVVWCTPGGDMTTNTKVKTIFTIPELHEKKVIEWEFHVTPLKMGACDVMHPRTGHHDLPRHRPNLLTRGDRMGRHGNAMEESRRDCSNRLPCTGVHGGSSKR